MKAAPLLVAWHENNDPVYSAHFEPQGKGRLATAGGDGLVRLWNVDANGDERKVTYLSTLKKHTQAVNVVRWCPRGELLASAGDDGNVLLWTRSENAALSSNFGDDDHEDVEHWRVKTMCRSATGAEIYDLAWSPDGQFFITGSMDNVARIYNATSGTCVRQIAEHNHYVQGVAWDPLNEYIATQSSDRSVHIYSLKSKDGQFTLNQHNKVTKMDLPGRRISSNSPAPQELLSGASRSAFVPEPTTEMGSPRPSAPGTPQSLALPMNPPPTSHSRRSSFGSQVGNAMRRSVSPSPSMPLPAVMPSASPSLSGSVGLGVRNANIYANETFTSFFRRLTFAPDGSLLFTPSGQYKKTQPSLEGGKNVDEIINTVYIYTRGGLNKPPIAHLPGHKKPSIAVKCSPVYYQMRTSVPETKEITIDTRTEDDIPPLPEPVIPSRAPTSHAAMDPPPLTAAPSPSSSAAAMPSPFAPPESEQSPSASAPPAGPTPAFGLPYRIVYAVASQDAVHLYDTQQQKPLCVVSNLHYATFTDLAWTSDGSTLLMTSSDGFCSALSFSPGELGAVYTQPIVTNTKHTPTPISVPRSGSTSSTPQPTPTASSSQIPLVAAHHRHPSTSSNPGVAQASPGLGPGNASPSPFTSLSGPVGGRPASPARSMSASSIATEASFARVPDQNAPPAMNNPTPSMGALPSLAAAGSINPSGGGGGGSNGMPLFTPPQTPGHSQINGSAANGSSFPAPGTVAGVKRESVASATSNTSESDEHGREKRRRIAPTPVVESEQQDTFLPPPSMPPASNTGNGG